MRQNFIKKFIQANHTWYIFVPVPVKVEYFLMEFITRIVLEFPNLEASDS